MFSQGNDNVTEESVEHNKIQDVGFLDSFDMRFARNAQVKAPSPHASSRASESGVSADQKIDEATKNGVAQVRKAHNAWDKATRDMSATALSSMDTELTQGSKFEKDMFSTIVLGNVIDEKLVKLETKFIQGLRYTQDELNDIASATESLKGYIKTGTRLTQALKAWFKVAS